jgi:hypothetical protein
MASKASSSSSAAAVSSVSASAAKKRTSSKRALRGAKKAKKFAHRVVTKPDTGLDAYFCDVKNRTVWVTYTCKRWDSESEEEDSDDDDRSEESDCEDIEDCDKRHGDYNQWAELTQKKRVEWMHFMNTLKCARCGTLPFTSRKCKHEFTHYLRPAWENYGRVCGNWPQECSFTLCKHCLPEDEENEERLLEYDPCIKCRPPEPEAKAAAAQAV